MADPNYSKISSILEAIGESEKLNRFIDEEFKDDLLEKITDPDDHGLKEGLKLPYGFRARFVDEVLKRRATDNKAMRRNRETDSEEDQLEGPSTSKRRQIVVNVNQANFKKRLDLKGDLNVDQAVSRDIVAIMDAAARLKPGTLINADGLLVGGNSKAHSLSVTDRGVSVPQVLPSSALEKNTAEDCLWSRLGSSRTNKKATKSYDKGRGHVLIIDNLFKGTEWERSGAEKDGVKMKTLFEDTLDCNVTHLENVGKSELQENLDDFKSSTSEQYKYIVVILMTHGGKEVNSILMNDGESVNLYKDFIYQFSNQKFPQFKNKPKIFLLQTCQAFVDEDEVDSSTAISGSSSGSAKGIELIFQNPTDFERDARPGKEPEVATDSIGWKGHLSHTLIAFAAIPYTYALRRTGGEKVGAYFINEISQVFSEENMRKYDLEELLKIVEENLEKRTKSSMNQRPQMSGYLNRGFRRFMFL